MFSECQHFSHWATTLNIAMLISIFFHFGSLLTKCVFWQIFAALAFYWFSQNPWNQPYLHEFSVSVSIWQWCFQTVTIVWTYFTFPCTFGFHLCLDCCTVSGFHGHVGQLQIVMLHFQKAVFTKGRIPRSFYIRKWIVYFLSSSSHSCYVT